MDLLQVSLEVIQSIECRETILELAPVQLLLTFNLLLTFDITLAAFEYGIFFKLVTTIELLLFLKPADSAVLSAFFKLS